ncbi:MAG: ABC transporter permease [Acidobacteriia bacterium]|nr:ABC transporter permease [Terriglobia bacterium]
METLLQDARYAYRTLRKAPGFTAVIVISIALGIAANTTVFSIANGLLWGVLPVKDPGRLVAFAEGESLSYPDFIDYRDQTPQVFEGGVCAHFPLIPASLGAQSEPERIWGQAVSGNYFSVAGVTPALGRGILPSEDQVPGRDAVVVLSHALWRRRFASNPSIIGREAVLNGQRYTVVGVTPPGFTGTDRGLLAEFWVPLAMAEQIMPDLAKDQPRATRNNQWLTLNARLKRGVSHAQAVAAVNVVKKRIDDTYRKDERQHQPPMTLDPAGGLLAGSQTPAVSLMAVLMVVVGLVLLVACANVANLLLARATGRQREVAIRLAMGASRRRLIRQLLTESVLLALGGAAVGFVLAAVAAHAISSFELPLPFPVVFDFNVDLRVLAFTAGLSILTGILFGLAPALRATRPDLVAALKNETTVFGRVRGFGLRNALVVVQVALSLVLLVSAGLFLRSMQNASSIDLGMKPDNILLMAFDPKLHNYSREKTRQFISELRQRVSALPGVRSVSFVDTVPLSIGGTSYDFRAANGKGGAEQNANADVYSVGANYFETLGIPLLRGRDFSLKTDDEHVAIINETMASHLFGNEDPLGRQLVADKTSYTIVGLARNSKSRTLGEDAKNCAFLFLEAAPEKIVSFFGISLAVKTSASPRTLTRPVRAEIATLDPDLAVFNLDTMREHVDKSLLLPRISATLLGVFGAVGLTLAAIGLYGVMSYAVRRRTREIGIRMALGAEPGKVLRMVLGQGLAVTAVGLAIGLGIALVLGRFTASLLYGISGTDLLTFLAVPAVLVAAALPAIFFPAYRAARVDPTTALRYE